MKALIYSIATFLTISLCALPSDSPFSEKKFTVHNRILAQVREKTISVLDLMKKMDLLFHQSYPHLVENQEARLQFYMSSWKHVLSELIDMELVLADAEEKKLEVTDGELRMEMEERFGPNIMITLSNVGLSYEEARTMVKNEMIVQRMTWYSVNSKALQEVTPQMIRQAYREFCSDNPSTDNWVYQVISIRSDEKKIGEDLAAKVSSLFSTKNSQLAEMSQEIKELEKSSEASLQISERHKVRSDQVSENYRSVLENLKEKEYSQPIAQFSRRDNKVIHRIFYLHEKTTEETPSFKVTSASLKEQLIQKAAAKESHRYLEKLRKYYGYDNVAMKEQIPDDFQPFSLQ